MVLGGGNAEGGRGIDFTEEGSAFSVQLTVATHCHAQLQAFMRSYSIALNWFIV